MLDTLRALYRHYKPEDWVIMAVADGTGYKPSAHQLKDLKHLTSLIELNYGKSVFTSASVFKQRPLSGGEKSEVLCSNKLWVDIDVEKKGLDRARVLEKLQGFRTPPSLIVDSGHGLHAYWFLNAVCYDLEAIEQRNYYLALCFQGDSVHNADRKLRVPGTVNAKAEPVESTVLFYSDIEYDLSEFESSISYKRELPLELARIPLPQDFEQRVKGFYGGHKIWAQMQSEETAREFAPPVKWGVKAGSIDRSENDWQIACWLFARNFTQNEVTSVLGHAEWFSGSKTREKGWKYLERTVSRAYYHVLSMVPPDIVVHDKEGKFSGEIAAKSIIEACHVQWYQGIAYKYVYDRYEAELGSLIYTVLSKALGSKLRMHHIDEVRKLILEQVELYSANEEDPVHWINLENGLLELGTGNLVEHTPNVFTPGQIPATWTNSVDNEARQTVLNFIGSVVGDDNVPVYFEQLGLTLTTEVPDDTKLLMLYGRSNTGKSQVMKFTEAFLGEQHTSAVDPSLLADEKFYLPALLGKRANIVNDTNVDYVIKYVTTLNQIISGESVAINQKFAKVKPTAKIFAKHFAATNKPLFAKTTAEGFDSRLIVLSCEHIWRDEDPNRVVGIFRDVLDRPGVRTETLRLAVEGYQRFMKQRGYTRTEASILSTLQHKKDVDPVIAFVLDCTEPAMDEYITQREMKEQVWAYCREKGLRQPKLNEIQYSLTSYSEQHPEILSIKFYDRGKWPGHTAMGAVYVGRRITVQLDTVVRPAIRIVNN